MKNRIVKFLVWFVVLLIFVFISAFIYYRHPSDKFYVGLSMGICYISGVVTTLIDQYFEKKLFTDKDQ